MLCLIYSPEYNAKERVSDGSKASFMVAVHTKTPERAIIIALVRAAMVLIFVECLINGTSFNGYYTPSTTRTSSGSHQPSQELN